MSKLPLRIVVAGPQGSGASTQARIISEHLDLPLICAEKTVRHEIEADTNLSRKAKVPPNVQTSGNLLTPDDVVEAIMLRALDHPEMSSWVLDGYPRRQSQAIALLRYNAPSKIFLLELPAETCRQRLAGRGHRIDLDASITLRHFEYFSETLLAMRWLERQWNYGGQYLNTINANQPIEKVTADILACLR